MTKPFAIHKPTKPEPPSPTREFVKGEQPAATKAKPGPKTPWPKPGYKRRSVHLSIAVWKLLRDRAEDEGKHPCTVMDEILSRHLMPESKP